MADYKLGVDIVVNNKSGREIADQVGKALGEAAKSWKDDIARNTAKGMAAGFKLAYSSGRSGEAIAKFVASNLTEVYEKFNKAVGDGNVKQAAKLERLLDKRTRQFEREAQAQADAYEAMQKRSAQTWAENADKFRNTVDDINRSMHMKDPSGYIGMGRQIGGRIAERGRARQHQAGEMLKSGQIDEAQAAKMASRGAMVAKIGVALGTIAAVAGAVLALIKLFMDLNDRIVDMNKAILKTGTISDMGIGGRAFDAAHKFNRELETMRTDVLAAASELDGFRVSSDEMFGTLGALNEYGKGFEKIADQIDRGATHLRNYGDAAELAITYAKLMGTSSEEMGQNMSRIANDMGQDFERVAEGLSAVRQEALLSGFSMKRFVGTIMEATSGMGAYAVRLEEAGKTLKFLSNIMGETAGAELFKSLTNAFTEASTSDRLKEILTTGQAEMADIFRDQALASAESIAKELDIPAYQGPGGGEALVRRISGMNEKDRMDMLARMKAAGYEPELVQRLDNLVEEVRAGNGDLDAMVNAMSTLGPAGTLAALTQSQVFGGRMLHEFVQEEGSAGRAAAEKLTGRTGKAFEALVDASKGTAADMVALRQIQKEVRDDGRKLSKEEQMTMAELYGATVDATGKIVGASADIAAGTVEMGEEITTEQRLMLAQNNRYKQAEEEAVSEDIKLARRVAQSTEKLANVMEANMLQVLNKIYKTVYDFWQDFLGIFGQEDPGIQGRIGAQNRFAREQQRAMDAMEQNSKAMTALQEAIETEKNPIRKKALQEMLQKRSEAQVDLESQRELAALAEEAVRNMDTEGKTQEDIQKKVADILSERGYELDGRALLDENAARAFGQDLVEGATGTGKAGGVLGGFFGAKQVGAASFYTGLIEEEGYGRGAESIRRMIGAKAGLSARDNLPTAEQQAELDAAVVAAQITGMSAEDFLQKIVEISTKQVAQEARGSAVGDILGTLDQDLGSIAENTNKMVESQKNLETGLKVKDMILPAGGGRPIITDPQDTLMAFKPGGAISQAMGGGGGGGPVTVNIYGGDPQKVYEQVMRVMKTLGHA